MVQTFEIFAVIYLRNLELFYNLQRRLSMILRIDPVAVIGCHTWPVQGTVHIL